MALDLRIVRNRIAVALIALAGAAPGVLAQGAIEPSPTKPLLGFDPAPAAGWKPSGSADGSGLVYDKDGVMQSIGVRVLKQRAAGVEQLKAAMQSQFGESFSEVLENKTTPLGWYAVVKVDRGTSSELIYVRTFGSKDTFCRGRIATTGPDAQIPGGVASRAEVVQVCEALHMKK